MKPTDQTLFGNKEGNCFASCVASIFEVPLDEVPNFCTTKDWYERLGAWANERGLYPIMFPYSDEWVPPGYAILSGKSPRGDFLHAVVSFKGEVIHDPHPSKQGILTKADWIIFAVFDPIKVEVRK